MNYFKFFTRDTFGTHATIGGHLKEQTELGSYTFKHCGQTAFPYPNTNGEKWHGHVGLRKHTH